MNHFDLDKFIQITRQYNLPLNGDSKILTIFDQHTKTCIHISHNEAFCNVSWIDEYDRSTPYMNLHFRLGYHTFNTTTCNMSLCEQCIRHLFTVWNRQLHTANSSYNFDFLLESSCFMKTLNKIII